MKGLVSIISFSNREGISTVESALTEYGFETDVTILNKCNQLSDISEYFISSYKELSTFQKSYIKDGNINQAAVLSIQSGYIEKAVTRNEKAAAFFIFDDISPESFYLKKLLTIKKRLFFCFGTLNETFGTSVMKGTLDIGFNTDMIKNRVCTEPFIKTPLPLPFNGKIAIEPPLDTIPLRYLYRFRSVEYLVREIIKTMNAFYGSKKHPPIQILAPVRPYSSYSVSTRGNIIEMLLGKRGMKFAELAELEKGTTVLTWSTRRYFNLLKSGMRPVPMTKSLALSTIHGNIKSIKDLIFFKPEHHDIVQLFSFVKSTGVENIPELMYKWRDRFFRDE